MTKEQIREAMRIIAGLADEDGNAIVRASDLTEELEVSPIKARSILDHLDSIDLLEEEAPVFHLIQEGREYIVKHDLDDE